MSPRSPATWGLFLMASAPAPASGIPPMLWIYGVALLASGVLALIWWARRVHMNRFLLEPTDPLLLRLETELEEKQAGRTGAMLPVESTDQAVGHLVMQAAASKPLFAITTDEPTRECPSCHRMFASWMAVCPFDNAALEPIKPLRRAHSPRTGGLDRMRCPRCERRFEPGTQNCHHDGTRLVADTTEEAALAPSFTVCRICGQDSGHGCAQEPCDMVTLDPARGATRAPILPMMRCPRCHRFGGLGQVQCVHDQEMLEPIMSVQTHAFPASGFGLVQKVCPRCGELHAGTAFHCARDGSRLITLH